MNDDKTISLLRMSKTGNSCRVEFTDGDTIYLPVDIVLKYKLKKDISISELLLSQITNEKKIIDAKRYAYYIVSTRMHSEYEIIQKLKFKKYENEQIEQALNFLKSQNFIDDEKFAESYALSCFKRKGFVADRIYIELLKKGINKEIAKKVVENFTEETEINEKIKILIEKKLRLKQNKSPEKQKTYIIRSLLELGYDYGIITENLKNYFEISE